MVKRNPNGELPDFHLQKSTMRLVPVQTKSFILPRAVKGHAPSEVRATLTPPLALDPRKRSRQWDTCICYTRETPMPVSMCGRRRCGIHAVPLVHEETPSLSRPRPIHPSPILGLVGYFSHSSLAPTSPLLRIQESGQPLCPLVPSSTSRRRPSRVDDNHSWTCIPPSTFRECVSTWSWA